jgi:putative tryptophan/tyrosine transport system substrate-binding protein
MKNIGFMHSGTRGNHDDHVKAFKAGLAFAGYDESGGNPNVKIPDGYADDQPANLGTIAGDFVKQNVDLLVAAGGSASALAAQAATNTKSIVFTSVSFSTRPAANMTGICVRTTELDQVRLNLLHELLPGETRFGVLYNSKRPDSDDQIGNLKFTASMLNLQLDLLPINPTGLNKKQIEDLIDAAFSTPLYKGALVTADPLFNNHRGKVITAAQNNNIPTIYQWREFANDGGLISYGPNLTVAYTLAGIYAGRVLSSTSATPAKDLPILSLSNFELVINLKAAQALSKFTLPLTLLARADDIIT